MLKGNTSYFKRIIYSEKEILTDAIEKSVYESFGKERALYHEVDDIICLCNYTCNLLIDEDGVSRDKISLIENGLKLEKLILSSEDKYLLKQ